MSIVKVQNKSALADILLNAMNNSRIFSATNVLMSGEKRKWIIHPKAGRQHIKGTGKPLDESLNMVRVYDMTRATTRDARGRYGVGTDNAWRTLRLDTLQSVKVDGVTYTTA